MLKLFSITILIFTLGYSLSNRTLATRIGIQKTNAVAPSIYTVTKIDSLNSYYLIYALRDNKLFKIVSKKSNISFCEKIKINKIYEFTLESTRDRPIKIGDQLIKIMPTLHVNCYGYDDSTSICLERDKGINDLFETKDLEGLCIVKTK